MIWDFILVSFRFFGEPEGIAKCYYAEFKRLDKFFVENSTLPWLTVKRLLIFSNIVSTLARIFYNKRGINMIETDATTSRQDTDFDISGIVATESLVST